MANDCTPIFEPGHRVTGHASVAVTGKCFCAITADSQAGFGLSGLTPDPLPVGPIGGDIVVGAPTAAAKGFGVAAYDAPAGGKVTILRSGIVPVTASAAAITAGQEVEIADTTGHVKTLASGVAVGRAVASCLASADCPIALY